MDDEEKGATKRSENKNKSLPKRTSKRNDETDAQYPKRLRRDREGKQRKRAAEYVEERNERLLRRRGNERKKDERSKHFCGN